MQNIPTTCPCLTRMFLAVHPIGIAGASVRKREWRQGEDSMDNLAVLVALRGGLIALIYPFVIGRPSGGLFKSVSYVSS
jgi:hypothetical protein